MAEDLEFPKCLYRAGDEPVIVVPDAAREAQARADGYVSAADWYAPKPEEPKKGRKKA